MIQLVLKDWSFKGLVFFGSVEQPSDTEILCAFDRTKKVVSL